MKALVSVLLAASMLALVFVPASAQTCANPYTVKFGDNLYRIGVAFGIPWPVIAAANNLANPNLIYAGQVLCIPPAGSTAVPGTPATAAPTAPRTATPVVITATVAPTTAPIASVTPAVTATRVPTATAVPPPPAFVIPTFTIIGVQRNTSVTIRTADFPANQSFTVMMGPIGTLGVNGTAVATTNSGAGGVFTATYPIPAGLANVEQISIRLQSPAGYYSYNWFYNFSFP